MGTNGVVLVSDRANLYYEARVAGLLGHSRTAVPYKHSSHLTSKADVLRAAAALVRPGANTAERATR